jgi:hypothetical protein
MGLFSFLGRNLQKGVALGNRVFGGIEKAKKTFGDIEKGARSFGSVINNATGVGDTQVGQKIYQAYDKVANLGSQALDDLQNPKEDNVDNQKVFKPVYPSKNKVYSPPKGLPPLYSKPRMAVYNPLQ